MHENVKMEASGPVNLNKPVQLHQKYRNSKVHIQFRKLQTDISSSLKFLDKTKQLLNQSAGLCMSGLAR